MNRLHSLSDEGQQVVADIAGVLLARLEPLVRELDDRVLAELPGDGEVAEELRETLDRSTHAQIGAALRFMRSWTDPALAQNSPDALELGRDFLRLGLPMDALATFYRRGHQYVWDVFYAELRVRVEDHELFAETAQAVSAFMFAYLDAIMQPLFDDYVSERERRTRLAETTRAEEVRRILAGEAVNPESASARLGYELRRWHVGFIAWIQEDFDQERVDSLREQAATELANALGVTAKPLVVPGAGSTVNGWIGSREPFRPAAALPRITGVNLAVGDPAEGLTGFRATHEKAALARRVSVLSAKRPGSSVAYRDVAVQALLVADVKHARSFVRDVLGPLADDDDNARRLLATLQVFYEEDSSFVRAGRRLNLHQNTIAYRVNRAIELATEDDASSLRLRIAVLLAPVLAAEASQLPASGD
jgi:hypothetical protein